MARALLLRLLEMKALSAWVVLVLAGFTAACSSGAGGSGGGAGGTAATGGTGAGGGLGGFGAFGGSAGQAGEAGGPSCSGMPITTSGVLDFDAKSVLVGGNVTLNGAALPDLFESRGRIVFEELDTGKSVEVDLRDSGPLNYQLRIPPGRYTVEYDANTSSCSGPTFSVMPCIDGQLIEELQINSDGAFDVDIRTVKVQGSVGINGKLMPDSSMDRGNLEFRLESGGFARTADFGPTGAAGYQITLLPGSYDVEWDGDSSLCSSGQVSPVPCNDGVVMQDVQLTTDGELHVDVPTVRVQGSVGINGQAMPAASGDRGALSFDRTDGNSLSTKSFGPSGPANYTATLLAGTYDVEWEGQSNLCDAGVTPPVPCNDGVLKKAVALTTDGELHIDVPAVRVQGAVGVNGKLMPDATGDRGAIEFRLDGGGSLTTKSFGPVGAASYAVMLLAGTYKVEWDGRSQNCSAGTPSPVPCNDGVLMKDVKLTTDGELHVDVPAVRVQGTVGINGKVMPDAAGDRGALEFEREDGGSYTTKTFGPVGPAGYNTTLLAGSYEVQWDGRSQNCQDGAPSPVPCNDGPVMKDVQLTVDGELHVDVPTVMIQGTVRLDGAPLPNASTDRGSLDLRLVGGSTLSTRAFDAVGAVNYSATLIAGNYVVTHDSRSELCQPGGMLSVPCLDQVLAGCP